MKKINVVTYCTYSSLGSILQTYALQKQLIALDYIPNVLMKKNENSFSNPQIKSFKGACRFLFNRIIIKKRRSAFKKRVEFINQKIEHTYFDDYEMLLDMVREEECDIYLSGSDQVWQPDKCDPFFFLDFAREKKCISYAASMGKTEISSDKLKLFQRMIHNFDYISVREEECVSPIKELSNKQVEVHIDPTFLVSADEWRMLSIPYEMDEPYILLYMLYWDDVCRDKIKCLKSKTGLKVFAIADGLTRVYADKVLYDVGVEEFLWLIDNAEYVITSSFHGTAFATIFNKKFSTIINPQSPSRINNLMRKLDLPFIEIENLSMENKFKYETTNKLIEFEREKSIEYLKKVTT